MKTNNLFKILCILCTAFISSCSSEFDEALTSKEESNKIKFFRTYEEALDIAQGAIRLLDDENKTRSTISRKIKDTQYILKRAETRSTYSLDTLMYVFNFEDNAGFAIISANPQTEAIIAITETGNYIPGESTGNTGFDLYMQLAEEYIATTNFLVPVDTTQLPLTEIKHVTVSDTLSCGPHISVRWGQNFPYYSETPIIDGEHCPAGCVATAVAQILSYYKHPTTITINYEAPSYVMNLDWEIINMHKLTKYNQCASLCLNPSETHLLIAKLFRQIGEELDMEYEIDGSGTSSNKVLATLSKFGYICDNFQTYQSSVVRSSLLNRRIVYMSGKEEGANIGHAWVIDGYKEISSTMTTYVRPAGRVDWDILRVDNSIIKFNHINWGWNGTCTGYFSTNVFEPSSANRYDSDVNTNSPYNFTENLKIYPNIQIQ